MSYLYDLTLRARAGVEGYGVLWSRDRIRAEQSEGKKMPKYRLKYDHVIGYTVTAETLESVERWSQGAIKGTALPRSERAVEVRLFDGSHEKAEVGDLVLRLGVRDGRFLHLIVPAGCADDVVREVRVPDSLEETLSKADEMARVAGEVGRSDGRSAPLSVFEGIDAEARARLDAFMTELRERVVSTQASSGVSDNMKRVPLWLYEETLRLRAETRENTRRLNELAKLLEDGR